MLKYSGTVRNSYVMRELKAAWQWWVTELKNGCFELAARLRVRRTEDVHAIFDPENLCPASEKWVFDSEIKSWKENSEKLTKSNRSDRGISISIPLSLCLVRTSDYPIVPAYELEQIIALELSTKTPFSADNASWTWRQGQGKHTDVILIKKDILNRLKDLADESGTVLREIRAAGTNERSRPFEKFETPHSRKMRFIKQLSLALLLSATTLASTAYGYNLVLKTQSLRELEENISNLRREAAVLNKSNQAYEAKTQARQELFAYKNERTSIVETWARLTQKLPKSVWLTELTIEANGGGIVGFTANAASLIELLEQDSTIEGVSFSTAVRIDPLTKAERFDIRFSRETPL
ncbi:PilN domain-containing protein [Labrenzia sp. PHM005]|uniref:PilN domain-containing protein n=1 Tax=Labrenzia sp. PHM005 TaxID=2590016 RepID=UPI00143CEB3C|nr:PilN domain-containing protein [Labrenzia sp. PHM005]